MTITLLIGWLLLSYGLMNIMVFGSIFQPLRDMFNKSKYSWFFPLSEVGDFISGILSCPMCFSTWGGFFLGLVVYSPTAHMFGVHPHLSWFLDGILSSGGVWLINDVAEYLEKKSN